MVLKAKKNLETPEIPKIQKYSIEKWGSEGSKIHRFVNVIFGAVGLIL